MISSLRTLTAALDGGATVSLTGAWEDGALICVVDQTGETVTRELLAHAQRFGVVQAIDHDLAAHPMRWRKATT